MTAGLVIGFFCGVAASMLYSLYVDWIDQRFKKGDKNVLDADARRSRDRTIH